MQGAILKTTHIYL